MKITDEEILKYDNIPVSIAAKYLGVGQMYIRIGLRRNRLPFGTAVQVSEKEDGQWSYHVSPGLLVSYKTGKYMLKPLIENLKGVVEDILDNQ